MEWPPPILVREVWIGVALSIWGSHKARKGNTSGYVKRPSARPLEANLTTQLRLQMLVPSLHRNFQLTSLVKQYLLGISLFMIYRRLLLCFRRMASGCR